MIIITNEGKRDIFIDSTDGLSSMRIAPGEGVFLPTLLTAIDPGLTVEIEEPPAPREITRQERMLLAAFMGWLAAMYPIEAGRDPHDPRTHASFHDLIDVFEAHFNSDVEFFRSPKTYESIREVAVRNGNLEWFNSLPHKPVMGCAANPTPHDHAVECEQVQGREPEPEPEPEQEREQEY